MSEILIFLADGFEEIEGLTVVDICRRARLDISMVSITDSYDVTTSHNIRIKTDVLYKDANIDDAKMLVLPGGLKGTESLSAFKPLTDKLKEFNEQGKMLAAICAAPSVLGENGILEGKKATCYPGFEDKLLGAEYVNDKAVVCDNVITGCGMGGSIEFALAIVEHFLGKEKADEIARQVRFVL